MTLIDQNLLDSVTSQAEVSQRKRMNFNFHETLEAKAQRLLNALEPGTELPIHRHCHTAETYVLLRGSIRVLFYNKDCELIESIVLNPLEGKYGVDIPIGQWHSLEVLEKGTVIFEVKEGPYTPIGVDDIMVL
jgi:cupin fold WbuC family metalloprotein